MSVPAIRQPTLGPITQRPAFVIAALLLIAILGFALVARLVSRYQQQQQALARHLYDQGLRDQGAGQFNDALDSFRAALMYDRDNFQYQLSLARALRDSGRTEESETYLISLWERNPQDSAVNLALGRLAARQGELDRTLQYYHNAIYGVWTSTAATSRENAQFELVDFLLRVGARPQAQAELITMAAAEPSDTASLLRIAQLFSHAQDYEHALAQYQIFLKHDPANPAGLNGAAQAAFHLGRFRLAAGYLQSSIREDPGNVQASQLLRSADLILQTDPFARNLSGTERMLRARTAFTTAGDRLISCAHSLGVDLNVPSMGSGLPSLSARWLALKPKVNKANAAGEEDTLSATMDLVSDIEQQTAAVCDQPQGMDLALSLMSQERNGGER